MQGLRRKLKLTRTKQATESVRIAHAVALLYLLGAWTSAAMAQQAQAEGALFRDVTYLGPDGDLRPHHTIVVSGDRIAWIGESSEPPPAKLIGDATVIDGKGRFLVPGLIDAHVHVTEEDLPLFLANGVTTIRELNGSPVHLELRERIESGEVLGPSLIVFSPLLAGEAQRWRHVLLSDPKSARTRAMGFAESGYDGLKIYDGLSPEVYAAIVDVAAETGMSLTGHIPTSVGLEGVLAAGQGLEHLEKIVAETVGRDFDHERIGPIARRIAAAGVPVTPTLAVMKFLGQARTSTYAERLDRSEMRFVDEGTLGWWKSLAPSSDRVADPEREWPSTFYAFQCELVVALEHAGVPLLIGTDTPNPLLVPGFSVHEELAALSEAGVSVKAILRAATREPARQLGFEGERGVITVGARADLVLVRRSPLEELATLADPIGTMVGGRWLDASALDGLLEGAEEQRAR